MQMPALTRLFILLLFVAMGCNNAATDRVKPQTAKSPETKRQSETPIKKDLESGKVLPHVPVLNGNGETYALYLPKKYSDSTKLPVIIFFDPHGNGDFPLNLYHELAEKYGYILIGSNDSKNGIPFNSSLQFANHLIQTAQRDFHSSAIFFCGFSGGAKVALGAASQNPVIHKLIYCGAAMPFHPNHPMQILGFAGIRDMNYTDVVSFDRKMTLPQVEHYLIEWKGKHEFPNAEVFEDAFHFLETGQVENYDLKKPHISEQKVAAEQEIKQEYFDAFQNKDLQWWQKTISTLEAHKEEDLMDERLLGFISLACYSLANQTLEQNNLAAAQKILAIYRMADPDNESIPEFESRLEALTGGT